MQRHIDINCDCGESFGNWRMGMDEEVMPKITSVNIACGFYAAGELRADRAPRDPRGLRAR